MNVSVEFVFRERESQTGLQVCAFGMTASCGVDFFLLHVSFAQILDRVAQSGYGISGGIDSTDDELGASRDTIDGIGSSDENLLEEGNEEKQQHKQIEMQEHAAKVNSFVRI